MPVTPLFQSTPLCEGRHEGCCLASDTLISIHSPLRGETFSLAVDRASKEKDFNPLPSARGDLKIALIEYKTVDFNPLPSARGDVNGKIEYTVKNNFNPLPSARGDAGYVSGA